MTTVLSRIAIAVNDQISCRQTTKHAKKGKERKNTLTEFQIHYEHETKIKDPPKNEECNKSL